MVCPLDPDARVEAACPGRTWFDALVEGWEDQGAARRMLGALHQRDLDRAAKPPVLNVTLAGHPGQSFRVDPEAGTVRFTAGGRPVLSAVPDDTVVIPAIRPGSFLP